MWGGGGLGVCVCVGVCGMGRVEDLGVYVCGCVSQVTVRLFKFFSKKDSLC